MFRNFFFKPLDFLTRSFSAIQNQSDKLRAYTLILQSCTYQDLIYVRRKGAPAMPWPDQRQIIKSEPFVSSHPIFCCNWISLNCPQSRSSFSFSTRAKLKPSLNWMPWNSSLIMWLSEELSCFSKWIRERKITDSVPDADVNVSPLLSKVMGRPLKLARIPKTLMMILVIRISSDHPDPGQINLINVHGVFVRRLFCGWERDQPFCGSALKRWSKINFFCRRILNCAAKTISLQC